MYDYTKYILNSSIFFNISNPFKQTQKKKQYIFKLKSINLKPKISTLITVLWLESGRNERDPEVFENDIFLRQEN